MDSFMYFKAGVVSEDLFTPVAFIGLLSCVDPSVLRQKRGVIKGLFTHVAFVGLLSEVSLFVVY